MLLRKSVVDPFNCMSGALTGHGIQSHAFYGAVDASIPSQIYLAGSLLTSRLTVKGIPETRVSHVPKGQGGEGG